MTKPKEYPLNRVGWAVFEVRKQGGSWTRGVCPIQLEKDRGEYLYTLSRYDPVCFIGETVNPQTGKKNHFSSCSYTKHENIFSEWTRREINSLKKIGFFKSVHVGSEGTKLKREFLGQYVCNLFLKLGRVPTRAELKTYILQKKETPRQIFRDLSSPDANSYMKRLMFQCSLQWLPTSSKGKKIIELPPPYGHKETFLDYLYNGNEEGDCRVCGRSTIRLFFQLERGEGWPPPKKKRGRPRKEEDAPLKNPKV